ncbi:homoserine O-acetyltransferase [Idiomarina sp. Sol25]|uniref:homoserine O-acetyltransferase family protein n=1 Tax=Idiomarina sp. Sol25 TaxID=3064000 RepID=UPI00294AC209|nr:homoserine O-acetyltransferase [Idiomarina sp. Sol25]MDV6328537.1 homoserine O-acetyltransferase [Idiomarina sp. Sol25]
MMILDELQTVPKLHTLVINETVTFECGKSIPSMAVTYSTWGQLNEQQNNIVWVCHPLTCGADPTQWWPELVGLDKVITPKKYFIVCVNAVGSCYGTSGPCSKQTSGSVYGFDFPLTTILDVVMVHQRVRNHLNIKAVNLGIGASFGGQQLIQWMALEPQLFKHACIAGANALQSPWAKAFNETQRMAIEADESFYLDVPNGGKKGLAAARSLAVLSYRSFETYSRTQAEPSHQTFNDFRASSYQRYIGEKFTKRFSAISYWYLTKAMDSHNIARHGYSLEQVLTRIQTNTLLLAMSGDVLFHEQELGFMDQYLPYSWLMTIHSTHGHDGLLANTDRISTSLQSFIDEFSI